MKHAVKNCFLLLICPLMLAGCATAPHVVEGPNKLTTMAIDTQDFSAKAGEMVQSLMESSVFEQAARKPAIIVVGRIASYAGRHIDTDLLVKKIRVDLNKSGKAQTDVTGGALSEPDFTLSGKIIENRSKQGNLYQSTYTFQLTLSNPQGLAVWEDEKEISKQSSRAGVGF